MCDFEQKVLAGLEGCGVSCKPGLQIGAAVSGGADSISLLISLCNILSPLGIKLKVITVNHNIRPAAETGGDALFVADLCRRLADAGKLAECSVVELKRGLVDETAGQRGAGTEEAARALRYQAFEDFCQSAGLDFLCLAHNKNDQLETLLMRFLQGASVEALAGIRPVRGQFIRPLLEISRAEIEAYLNGLGQAWRTDNTNFDDKYLRNKIRLKLLPFLNENFEGWQTALMNGSQRWSADGDLISALAEDFPLVVKNGLVQIDAGRFAALQSSLKIRVLLRACNLAGESRRIPYSFLMDILVAGPDFTKRFSSLEFTCKNNILFIKKYNKSTTDLIFFDIIEDSGIFDLPFGSLQVFNKRKACNGIVTASIITGNMENSVEMELPFIVRNARLEDEIKTSDGSFKKVSDIFNDWKVSERDKALLPVFQEVTGKSQAIFCLLGSFLGYKDWIVKK